MWGGGGESRSGSAAARRVVRGRDALVVLWSTGIMHLRTYDLALTDVDSCCNYGKHIVEETSSARQQGGSAYENGRGSR